MAKPEREKPIDPKGLARRAAILGVGLTTGALAAEAATGAVSRTARRVFDAFSLLISLDQNIVNPPMITERLAANDPETQIDRLIETLNQAAEPTLARLGLKDREIRLGKRSSLPPVLNTLRERVRELTLDRFLTRNLPIKANNFYLDISHSLRHTVAESAWQAIMEKPTAGTVAVHGLRLDKVARLNPQAFAVALEQAITLNGQKQVYVDYGVVDIITAYEVSRRGNLAPKFTLVDLARKTPDGRLTWLSDVNQTAWQSLPPEVRQTAEAVFNPNPLLHPNEQMISL